MSGEGDTVVVVTVQEEAGVGLTDGGKDVPKVHFDVFIEYVKKVWRRLECCVHWELNALNDAVLDGNVTKDGMEKVVQNLEDDFHKEAKRFIEYLVDKVKTLDVSDVCIASPEIAQSEAAHAMFTRLLSTTGYCLPHVSLDLMEVVFDGR